MMKQRLQTILSQAGVASRRKTVEIIESGKVKVDGKTVTNKGFRVDPGISTIAVDGKVVKASNEKHYYMLNKPRGVVSTALDTHGRVKVTDLINNNDARIYPVGRLDKNTTGLLLLTNDGEMTLKLTHPSSNIDKEYLVKVLGMVKLAEIKKLEKGVELDGKMTSPCTITLIKKTADRSVLKIVLHEGRKRQIRRMFENIGHKVSDLDRIKYAGLTLGRLGRGEYRELTVKEVEKLKDL